MARATKSSLLAPENILDGLLALVDDRAARRLERLQEMQRRMLVRKKALAAERFKRANAKRQAVRAAEYRGDPGFGNRLADLIVMTMRPGEWYGQRDIVRACGLPRKYNWWTAHTLRKAGLIERRRNPAYKGQVEPQRAARGLAEPVWLYRLTARGVATREALEILGSVGC